MNATVCHRQHHGDPVLPSAQPAAAELAEVLKKQRDKIGDVSTIGDDEDRAPLPPTSSPTLPQPMLPDPPEIQVARQSLETAAVTLQARRAEVEQAAFNVAAQSSQLEQARLQLSAQAAHLSWRRAAI